MRDERRRRRRAIEREDHEQVRVRLDAGQPFGKGRVNHDRRFDVAAPTGDFRVGDVRHSLANVDKARRLLGYAPTHTMPQGLELALDWYVANVS